MLLVAVTHVAEASHATVGPDWTVVAVVARVTLPVVNVVDVAVMFHPAPDPVASPMSRAWVAVGVWSLPLSVSLNVTLGAALTNPSVPADTVTVALVAPAGGAAAQNT